MSYSFIAAGALTIANNTAMTPALPAGYAAAQLLVLHAGETFGGDSLPSLTSQGWTQLSSGTVGTGLWGRIAAGNSSDQPTFQIGTFWQYAQIFAYSGNPSTITGIVNQVSTRSGNDTLGVFYSATSAPSVNGCLAIAAGSRNKTTTVNGATYGSMTNYTLRSGSPVASSSAQVAPVYNDWIQTTATASPSMHQNLSITDSTEPQFGNVILLNPGSASTPSTSRLASMGVG